MRDVAEFARPELCPETGLPESGVPMARDHVGTLLGSYASGVPMMEVVDFAQRSGAPVVVCHAGIWHSTWHTTLRAARASEKILLGFGHPLC